MLNNLYGAISATDFNGITNAISENISAADVVTVMGIAITSSFGIYIVVWGGKKIVRAVRKAINGKFGI